MLARKERKLEKGCGESWDLMLSGWTVYCWSNQIIGVCCLFSSLFGLPWMCAAAVQTLAHSNSLTVNQKKAPGEQPGKLLSTLPSHHGTMKTTQMFYRSCPSY